MHPRPSDHLEQIEDHVAVVERVPEQGNRPDFECRRSEPDEVRMDAIELGEGHPSPRGAARDLHLEELLDGEDEDELVRLEREVVDPRRVRDGLPPRLRLHVLLEPGVQVPDDRVDACDRLAVEVDDEPQHAVRGGMVRPEVDRRMSSRRVLLGVDLEDRRDGLGMRVPS